MTTATTQTAVPAETLAPVPQAATTVFSTTALVLGIVGIVIGQGFVSIAAIVFGFIGRSKEPSGRLTANWGIALGFVGVFGGILLALIGVAAFVPLWVAGALSGWY
ncbi:MAG TPA: hypothetical protein VGO65_00250 [Pseudolysinimonas sp.]|jgi:hypothetical protein|nr:hypothetical protein [Pseudolysinimonas sp.]